MEKILLFEDINSDQNAWKEERKKHLTGSNIAQLMWYMVDGEKLMYGSKNIKNFTHDKFNDVKPNEYMQKVYKIGHLYEDYVHEKVLSRYSDNEKYKIYRNRAYKKDFIMASLDIEILNTETDRTFIFECKTTSSEKSFQSAKEGRHSLYWQCATQLYVMDNADCVYCTYKFIDKYTDYVEEYHDCITRDSYYYQKLVEYIPRLKEIHELVMQGKEPFFEQKAILLKTKESNKEPSVFNDLCTKIAELRIQMDTLEEDIKKLREDKLKLSNELDAVRIIMLDQFGDVVHLQEYEHSGYKFTLQKRPKEVYFDDFKDIEDAIKADTKDLQKIQIDKAKSKYFADNGKLPYTIDDTLVIMKR